jgi:hypothetical protein
VLLARNSDFVHATYFMIALFANDLVWSLIWRFVGEWDTKDGVRIKYMEKNLQKNITLDVIFLILFGIIMVNSSQLSSIFFVILFITIYCLYMALTFLWKVISIQIF